MKKINTTGLVCANVFAFAFLMFFIMRAIAGSEEMRFSFGKTSLLMITLGCIQLYFSIKLIKYRREQHNYSESGRDRLKRISRDVNSDNPTYEFKHSKFEEDLSQYSDDEK